MALAKLILIIGGIVMAGAVGFVAYKNYYSSWSGGSVEISGTPTDGIKMDIPDHTGKKIGEVEWTGSPKDLVPPFGTLIPIFEPSQQAGKTQMDDFVILALLTSAGKDAVKDFYLGVYNDKWVKDGWVIDNKMPGLGKILSISRESSGWKEAIIIGIFPNKDESKPSAFTITYQKKKAD